jgi:hypothetical protein
MSRPYTLVVGAGPVASIRLGVVLAGVAGGERSAGF